MILLASRGKKGTCPCLQSAELQYTLLSQLNKGFVSLKTWERRKSMRKPPFERKMIYEWLTFRSVLLLVFKISWLQSTGFFASSQGIFQVWHQGLPLSAPWPGPSQTVKLPKGNKIFIMHARIRYNIFGRNEGWSSWSWDFTSAVSKRIYKRCPNSLAKLIYNSNN